MVLAYLDTKTFLRESYVKMLQGLKNFPKMLRGPDLASDFSLQGLHFQSSGKAPENAAAKDTVVAEDDAPRTVPQRTALDLILA